MTPEEIQQAVRDNAGYDVNGDCAMAGAYLTALRQLQTLPDSATHGNESLGFDRRNVPNQITEVKNWMATNCQMPPTSATQRVNTGAIHFDYTGFRR